MNNDLKKKIVNISKKRFKNLNEKNFIYFILSLSKLINTDHNLIFLELIESIEINIINDSLVYNFNKNPKKSFNKSQHFKRIKNFLEKTNIDDIFNTRCLLNKIYPKQKSEEWLKSRENLITASDAGTTLGLNKYENLLNLIIKKVDTTVFINNIFCFHGNIYEKIASMIFELLNNVSLGELGLIISEEYKIIGGSPDGIVKLINNNNMVSEKVGRLVEIKCPLRRKIVFKGNLIGDICPIHYWAQIQIQLQSTKSKVCDFFQCEFDEYKNLEEFEEDSNIKKNWVSKKYNNYKGCMILLIKNSKEKIDYDDDYMYSNYFVIYPPILELSNKEYKDWIIKELVEYQNKYSNYIFKKIILWKLKHYSQVEIIRDDEWFKKNINSFKEINNYISFYKNNKDKFNELIDFSNEGIYDHEEILDYLKKSIIT